MPFKGKSLPLFFFADCRNIPAQSTIKHCAAVSYTHLHFQGLFPGFRVSRGLEGVMTLLEQEGFLSVFFNGGFEQVDNRLFHS